MAETPHTRLFNELRKSPDYEVIKSNSINPGIVLVHISAFVDWGRCTIGGGTIIGPFASIGNPPEINSRDYKIGRVHIGENVDIRPHVTIDCGTADGYTAIQSGVMIMNKSHIGHDAEIGRKVTISPGANIGGFCQIGEDTRIGMNATIHNRRLIGKLCMIGMSAVVTKDIPDYALAYGTPARIHGKNVVGLERAGIRPESVKVITDK